MNGACGGDTPFLGEKVPGQGGQCTGGGRAGGLTNREDNVKRAHAPSASRVVQGCGGEGRKVMLRSSVRAMEETAGV